MRVYKNIGTIDLRRATPEIIGQISEIVNVGTLIVAEGQISLIGHIKQENIGSFIVLPDGEEVGLVMQNGDYTIDQPMLSGLNRQMYISINGQLIIKEISDATNFSFIKKISVNGEAFVPSSVSAQFASVAEVNGDVIFYNDGDVLMTQPFKLNEETLWGIRPNSVIRATDFIALDAVDMEAVMTHINKIHVRGKLVATRDHMRALAPLVEDFANVERFIVPEGYAYFNSLKLDAGALSIFEAKKVFVAETLKIEASADAILAKIQGIICGTLKIKEETFDAIKHLVEKANHVKLTSSSSNTRSNYSKMLLTPEGLDQFQDVDYDNYGVLKFELGVQADTVRAAFKSITNYGVIKCSPEIYNVIMAKITDNYGSVKRYEATDEGETSGPVNTDAHGWENKDQEICNLASVSF